MHIVGGALRAATLVFILLPGSATAQQIQIRGGGAASCGTWVSSQGNSRSVLLNWVLGFVTAINVNRSLALSTGDIADVLNGADPDAIELWMTNYCMQNPLKQIWNASIALIAAAERTE